MSSAAVDEQREDEDADSCAAADGAAYDCCQVRFRGPRLREERRRAARRGRNLHSDRDGGG